MMSSPDRMMHHVLGDQFQRPPHVKYMGEIAQRVLDGPQRIIVEVSVRHGKSWLWSWAMPCWYLSLFPHRNVVLAAHTASFAAEWGRRCRNFLNEHGGYLGTVISEDSRRADSWKTHQGGGFHTCGVGGEVTGRGFDCIIVDDPIKTAEQANSEVMRNRVWEWWQGTIRTRLEPGGSIIVVMARWHEDDLVGRLKRAEKDGAEKWNVISLPALAEENDPMGREPGKALWPERYNEEELEMLRLSVGSYAFSSLYQQRPQSASGATFCREWIRHYSVEGDFYVLRGLTPGGKENPWAIERSKCYRYITVDLAFTANVNSDYTVAQVWDRAPGLKDDGGGDMILVDQWRVQTNPAAIEDGLKALVRQHNPIFVGIEDTTSSKPIIDRFRRDGLPVRSMPAQGTKVSRSTAATVWMANERIWLPKHKPWYEEFESELLAFPLGAHDDQVDAFSYAVIAAADRNLWREPAAPKHRPGTLGAISKHEELLRQTPIYSYDPFSGQ